MRPRRGFTLVELLVVIAIIGILAGFVAAGLPRVIEKAKIRATQETMRQLRNSLVAYYTDHNSLPPMYGYVSNLFLKDIRFADPAARPSNIIALYNNPLTERDIYFLVPWMAALREHGNQELYDNWTRANGYDTDDDDQLSQLEFAPLGVHQPGTDTWTFPYQILYRGPLSPGDTATENDMNYQLDDVGPRPLVYVGVNERQARTFSTIIYEMAQRQGNPSDPRPINLDQQARDAIQTRLSFPPPSYDAFVLISVGPEFVSGTHGLLLDADDIGLSNFSDPNYAAINEYHLLGLATYFMATRDAENGGQGDGELDFDFQARTSRGQARDSNNDLPGPNPKLGGPLIYVGNI